MKIMYRILLATISLVVLSTVSIAVNAQFNISVPKVPKVKKDTPKPDQPSPPSQSATTGTSNEPPRRSASGYPTFSYERAPSTPKFLGSSIEISVKTEHLNEFSKFIPKI